MKTNREFVTTFILLLAFNNAYSQINSSPIASFDYINIPTTARAQYLGRAAIATYEDDMMLYLSNPSLVDDRQKGRFLVSTSSYFDSYNSNISYSTFLSKFKLPLYFGTNFNIYNSQNYVNIDGQKLGVFSPYQTQLFASTAIQYDNYRFGGTVKLLFQDLFLEKSIGVALDASAMYVDPYRNITATLLLKNIGSQLYSSSSTNYTTPFDIQLAVSKRFKHIPFRLTVMAHSLYQLDVSSYSDDYGIYAQNRFYSTSDDITSSIFSHLVIGGELLFGKGFKMGFNYDFQKNEELNFSTFRGLSGFSFGAGVYTKRFNIGYSIAKPSSVGASNMISFVWNPRSRR